MPLIVGLGNPGPEYDDTPHNVGFAVAARLAEQAGVRFRRLRFRHVEEAILTDAPRAIIARPLTYMNLSGGPVRTMLKRHGVPLAELLVVCDDVNLPPGVLRLRPRGGAGGQKGLRSIIDALGTEEFARLRIGVGGGAAGADVARHVLKKWRGAARDAMETAIDAAADTVQHFLRDGIDAAMNRCNAQRPDNQNNPSGDPESPDK